MHSKEEADRFRETLLSLMKEKGLDARDVAELVDVSVPTVRRWIAGQNEPHELMWKHLFQALEAK